jgi:hypothetical protein
MNLLAFQDHCCLEHGNFVMCRVSPQLPLPLLIPVLPEVSPKFLQVMCFTKIVHLLNSPTLYPRVQWGCIPGNHQMRTVMPLHHFDDSFVINQLAEGSPCCHPLHILNFLSFITGAVFPSLLPNFCDALYRFFPFSLGPLCTVLLSFFFFFFF